MKLSIDYIVWCIYPGRNFIFRKHILQFLCTELALFQRDRLLRICYYFAVHGIAADKCRPQCSFRVFPFLFFLFFKRPRNILIWTSW